MGRETPGSMGGSSMGTPETATWPVKPRRGRILSGGGRSQPGTTLLELLLVMAILATLAAVASSVYLRARDKAMNVKAIGDIAVLQKEVLIYRVDRNGALPGTLADIGRGFLRDSWGNPYQYLDLTTAKGKGSMRKDRFLVPLNSDFDLYSMGKDGQSKPPLTAKESRDDIIRANDGAFIG